jgi:hypothetical protein
MATGGRGHMIDANSVSLTVDAVNAVFIDGRRMSAAERGRVAHWIAGRQGLPGAYADTFAGFPGERAKGIVLFTGERIGFASARHILGEEACRVLHLLGVRDKTVTTALERATAGLMRALQRAALDPRNTNPGLFCCGKCSIGLWRHLLAGGLDRQEERLRRGVQHLRSMRDGEGGWRTFPFWYTVLALSDVDDAQARRELRYAAPQLERAASKRTATATFPARRQAVARRALESSA